MLSVASLLNPSEEQDSNSPLSSISKSSISYQLPPILPSIEKQKVTDSTVILSKGDIRGEIRYPPFEDLDEETIQKIQKFHVYPLGGIRYHPRHIPYSSGKKSYLKKTGRESFEVFQYVFRAPTDDKDHTVMWDYNTGLVRITPFFKCCKYTKVSKSKDSNTSSQ
ncbi:hypothetical protein K3495_g1319 [Podosphaera aphanis]|nr:hypothetical protein K3495_g1319 [Podosphaera aphanis]